MGFPLVLFLGITEPFWLEFSNGYVLPAGMEDLAPPVNKVKASRCITGNDTSATDTRIN